MCYLVSILFSVGWIQGAIIRNYKSSRSPISNKYFDHGIGDEMHFIYTSILEHFSLLKSWYTSSSIWFRISPAIFLFVFITIWSGLNFMPGILSVIIIAFIIKYICEIKEHIYNLSTIGDQIHCILYSFDIIPCNITVLL